MRFWDLEDLEDLELGKSRRTFAGVALASSSEVKARQKSGSHRYKTIPASSTACAGSNFCTERTLVTDWYVTRLQFPALAFKFLCQLIVSSLFTF